MNTLSIIIFIILMMIMFLLMTPPILWFIMNIKKYRGTYSWKLKRIVFWSWFICYGIALLLGVIISIIAFS